MNFANITQLTMSIFSYQDYNESVYCYQSALRENQIHQCLHVPGMLTYEYFVLFSLQVRNICVVMFLRYNLGFKSAHQTIQNRQLWYTDGEWELHRCSG